MREIGIEWYIGTFAVEGKHDMIKYAMCGSRGVLVTYRKCISHWSNGNR